MLTLVYCSLEKRLDASHLSPIYENITYKFGTTLLVTTGVTGYCLHQNICFGHGQFEMVSLIYLFQYIWYRMLWIVYSEETDIILTLMMTFRLMNILCMHGSDIMVLTACVM